MLQTPGRPLDRPVLREMEARFGHDFSRVRVHTDERAVDSARVLRARAYTVGSHVVLASSRHALGTQPGRRLLAHELAHVVQQRDGPSDARLELDRTPALEREAAAAADAVAAGREAKVAATAAPALQRQEELTQVWRVGPIDALHARSDARRALADARRSGLPGQHNGPADAWRHCYWNCLMTRSIGEDQAREVADTHEEFGANPPNETAMDLHNNAVGRACGRARGNCGPCCMTRLTGAALLIIPDYAGAATLAPMPSGGVKAPASPPPAGSGGSTYY